MCCQKPHYEEEPKPHWTTSQYTYISIRTAARAGDMGRGGALGCGPAQCGALCYGAQRRARANNAPMTRTQQHNSREIIPTLTNYNAQLQTKRNTTKKRTHEIRRTHNSKPQKPHIATHEQRTYTHEHQPSNQHTTHKHTGTSYARARRVGRTREGDNN